MLKPSRMFLVVVLLLLSGVGGCGRKNNFVSVRGTVTYLGKPLPDALVVFMPETPGVLPASGLTDSNGRYALMTSVQGDGGSVGKHRVTVTARGPDKERPADEVGLTGSNTEPGDPLIPIKYFTPDTSGLEAEVTSGGITANFNLK